MKLKFTWICTVIALSLTAQKKTDTLRLYYAINEISSSINTNRIDSALKAQNGKYADVAIIGFADFLHNEDYNRQLSLKRAQTVKSYLLKKSNKSQFNIYKCDGVGESYSKDNGSEQGEPSLRRVDIYFEPIVTINVADDKLETPAPKETVKLNTDKKEITELEAGESLALEGMGFEPGRHFILKESIPVLQKLLETLQANKTLKIEIQGHVCCTVDGADGMDLDTRELKLSVNRAKAIYDFLIRKGIDKNRLSYKGFGRTKPKFEAELTPEEEQANRRVEIMVIEK